MKAGCCFFGNTGQAGNALNLGFELRLPATAYGKFGFGLNGTYVMEYKVQDGPGRTFADGVGRFANDQVVQRWRIRSSNFFTPLTEAANLQRLWN